jgi:hypothetical protein
MLWNLDFNWLLMAIAVVAMLSFVFGLALDGLMGSDGFGALGNAVIVTSGFFLGILAANSYGIPLRDLTLAAVAGLSGAFLCLSLLAGCKAALTRLL